MSSRTSKIDTMMQKAEQTRNRVKQKVGEGGLGLKTKIDIENIDLEGVRKEQDGLQENMVYLISELDSLTSSVGDEFKTMQEKTMSESIVSIFSEKRSKAMRSQRIKNSSISNILDDLIVKSDKITTMLAEHNEILDVEQTTVSQKLDSNLQEIETNNIELEEVTAKIEDLQGQIAGVDADISKQTSKAAKSSLEIKRKALVEEFNATNSRQKELTAIAQTLSDYTEKLNVFLQSLEEQKTSNKALISKIDIDKKQRQVMYSATEQALKTAAHQEVAGEVNRIGTHVDSAVTQTMAAVGAAGMKQLADIGENHEEIMKNNAEIAEKQQAAAAEFQNRFAHILENYKNS